MTETHTPVVFLSGAGLPAWIWDDVRSGLPAGTESVVARYPRGGTPSLAEHADFVLAQVSWPAFAVVAHSIGGVVAAEVCGRSRSRVRGVLGVAAVVPRPGRSFTASLPFPGRFVLPALMRVAGTRPPAKAIRAGLARGLPGSVADRIVADFDPESPRLYRDAASERELPAVRGYLVATGDREIDVATQRRSAAVLGATWTEELPAGHLPMLEDPQAVARAVRRLLGSLPTGTTTVQPSGSPSP